MAIDFNGRIEFDHGVFVRLCAPRSCFTVAESLVDEAGVNEFAPDLSFSSFHSRPVVADGDVGQSNAFSDGCFFIATTWEHSEGNLPEGNRGPYETYRQ